MTNGTQRANKKVGISYDYMDKLNGYVKAGIFVDKDNDGFTKAEQKALGAEFNKLHQERGDLVDFKKMLAGKSFDYKNEEFVRLAKAAGYVLAEENKPVKKPVATKTEEVKSEVPVEQKEEKSVQKPQEQPKAEAPKTETSKQQESVTDLNKDLEKLKAGWTEDELLHSATTLQNKLAKLSTEIEELQKDYTTQTVTKHRFLRKAKTEKVKVPKSEEQLAADNKKAQEKMAKYDKLAQMRSVNELYSSKYPSKYAPNDGDKMIEYIATAEDGQRYGVITKKVSVYDKTFKYSYDKSVPEYYPITLKNRNEGTENPYPDYYYRVDENAKPVEGEIKLAKND